MGTLILDKDYTRWVKELAQRYRTSQIKAAVKVNQEVIKYYWNVGHDIVERQYENKYGSHFYTTLSNDLRNEMQGVDGMSERSIRYMVKFYLLYKEEIGNLPQVVAESSKSIYPQLGDKFAVIPHCHSEHIIRSKFFM